MKTRMRSVLERVVSYGLAALAFVGLTYFLTHVNKAHMETMRVKEGNLATLKADIEESNVLLAKRQKDLQKIMQDLNQKEQEIKDQFNRLLKRSSDYTTFIEAVQDKARLLNITILGSKYQPPGPMAGAPANYLEFQFSLEVVGAYSKMKQFLWELENKLGRLVRISKLTIHPPICSETGEMKLSLTLSTFFVPD